MAIEIEAKIKADDLESLARRLLTLGAKPLRDLRQEDIYFDSPDGRLKKTGCGLRLRRQTAQKNQNDIIKDKAGAAENSVKAYLTFKGPVGDSVYKSRPETEVQVSDFQCALQMLEALGYKRRIAFEKRRRIFGLAGCLVCLDELPVLGRFVEVEGPDEDAIGRVLKDIGLDGRSHISEGYAKMMAAALRKNRKQKIL